MAAIHIEPWGSGDQDLLALLVGDPAMMAHLGGPETAEQIADRQARYEQPGSRQYRIVDDATGAAAGWVGYWERDWQAAPVYEIGWAVAPVFQRRGFAVAATALAIDLARAERARRYVHAFPAIDNGASNAVCRKLGFALAGERDFEYPKGTFMRCNDWRLDLSATPLKAPEYGA
jgi:RimJ/RimL family protein N-acetyltransferase